jgi:subtilisin family serine protease
MRAAFSNTGSWISLAAPGERVYGAVLHHGYGYGSGTSFATPQVAGAAALVWAARPSLTAEQVAQILEQTATDHGAWTPELGWGVIDVGAAVERALQFSAG